jgi:hypothetical protein
VRVTERLYKKIVAIGGPEMLKALMTDQSEENLDDSSDMDVSK